jgi:hypothetical protein
MTNRFKRDIQDYLDATGDASQRTRTATIMLVITTVIVFAGLLNSQQSNWMHSRLARLADETGSYSQSKLGNYPKRNEFPDDASFKQAVTGYDERYKSLWDAVARTYVDNSWIIRVPFLGFTFDVNDLGLLGGIGFVVVFVCYRFFLTREVDNLRLSFEEARRIGRDELEEFYKLLAMRQVFTVPRTKEIKRTDFLVLTPKLICWFPIGVYAAVLWNDLGTAWIGQDLRRARYAFLVSFEGVTLVCLVILAYMVTARLIRMDNIWDAYWQEIQGSSVSGRPESVLSTEPSS